MADVKINGESAGRLFFAPFEVDITDHVKPGKNTVEVVLTTCARNGFVGKAMAGDKRYARFKKAKNLLVASGLVGPVTVQIKRLAQPVSTP